MKIVYEFLSWFIPHVYGYSVHIPPNANGEKDYKAPISNARIDGEESDIYRIIDYVTDHLRFFLAVIAFVAVLYSAIKIATASETDRISAVTTMIKGVGFGLLVAIFSYAILRLVINLL